MIQTSCKEFKEEGNEVFDNDSKNTSSIYSKMGSMINAIDASFIPELRASNIDVFDNHGNSTDFLDLLSKAGFNTIRLRIWHTPSSEYSGFTEVKKFSDEIKEKGMKVWLTVHYSDTWADPTVQDRPVAWKNLNFQELKDSVFQYTSKIMTDIKPDYIQIGNEINNGFLWPKGRRSNLKRFKKLINMGISAVRNVSTETKIMLHFAGHSGALEFFNDLVYLDYDVIALSYYPYWHGNDLSLFEAGVNELSMQFNKEIIIAETTYPFATIDDTEDYLVPGYPATPTGQSDFVKKIAQIIEEDTNGIGLGIWGGVIGAYQLPKPTTYNGTHWENQAMLDYNNIQLPVLDIWDVDSCQSAWLVGNALDNVGWDWTNSISTTCDAGVQTIKASFVNGGTFRIFENYNSWDTNTNYQFYIDQGYTIDTNLEANGSDSNFLFTGTDGMYILTVDTNTKEITLTASESLWAVGGATPGGWNLNTNDATEISEISPDVWQATFEFTNSNFRFFETTDVETGNWSSNHNYYHFEDEGYSIDSDLQNDDLAGNGNGDGNFLFSGVPGIYTLIIDAIDKKIILE